jgi:O-antigen ligase
MQGKARPAGVMSAAAHESRALRSARWLVITMLVALMFSPPVTNLAQFALVVLVFASSELRGRIWQACRQPMVIGALAFFLVVSLGMLYTIDTKGEAASIWNGWRKILMLPLVVALFYDVRWKLRLVHVTVGVAAVCAVVSYIIALVDIVLVYAPGIIIRNHATQGMIFSVAAFAAAVLAIYTTAGNPRQRFLLIAAAILLVSNVALITPGRSGYLVLLICSGVLACGWLLGGNRVTWKSVLLVMGAMGAVLVILATAPTSRQRINQAVNEMQNYQQQEGEVTSMGARMYFWQNTITLIQKRPLLGYGTGAFEDAYRPLVEGKPGLAGVVTSDPHNQFLKIATEHGLLGLAVFLAFLVAALMQRPSMQFRILGWGVLAAWCATSLANSHFSTFSEGLFIYLWLGAMLANEVDTARTA